MPLAPSSSGCPPQPAPTPSFVLPPPPVVYQAAIVDLERIAAAPGSVTPEDHGNRGSLGLLAVAAAALLALGLAALSNALRRKGDALEAMAWTDGLTGVGNRRKLDRDLAVHRQAHDGQTAVIMVDIDHFKAINDQFGAPGRRRRAARASAPRSPAQVREGDVVYRYGGEEFCVLLPGATQRRGGRSRRPDRHRRPSIALPDEQHITVSVGVAEGSPTEVVDTLETADRRCTPPRPVGRATARPARLNVSAAYARARARGSRRRIRQRAARRRPRASQHRRRPCAPRCCVRARWPRATPAPEPTAGRRQWPGT